MTAQFSIKITDEKVIARLKKENERTMAPCSAITTAALREYFERVDARREKKLAANR